MNSREIGCFNCGSHEIYSRPYLRGSVARSPVRELIYKIPSGIISRLGGGGTQNSRLNNNLNCIIVNKKFFSGRACFCFPVKQGGMNLFLMLGNLLIITRNFTGVRDQVRRSKFLQVLQVLCQAPAALLKL